MLKVLIVLLSIGIIACSGAEKQASPEEQKKIKAENEEVKKQFNKALSFLDTGQYNRAGVAFKRILAQHPTTDIELLIVYNLGGALEGLDKCEAAAQRYREVINKSIGRQPRLEAQAFLRLSYVYECLGDDAKLVGSLLSVLKNSSSLPDNISKAEIPARLAAAYARQGSRAQAKSYFVMAQEGLKSLNSNTRNPKKKKELLAKTLYFMGNLKKLKIERLTPELYIESLTYLQNYLLMSAELDHIEWSPLAAGEILKSYDEFYRYTVALEPASSSENYRQQKQRRLKQYEQALVSIYNLNQQRIPQENEPRVVKQLFRQMAEREIRIKNALSQLSEGNELTPEALRRKS